MPDTIGTVAGVSRRCAVFKVDLKGRIVYIDDTAEEVFGTSCDNLIGRLIFEYVAAESLKDLERLFNTRSRYESFYETLPLTVCTPDNQLNTFSTVVTLNFIGGNPVNYQFILIPSGTGDSMSDNYIEKRFLTLLDHEGDKIDYHALTEILGKAGGYLKAECYQIDIDASLIPVGSWPRGSPEYTPPVYIQELAARSVEMVLKNKEVEPTVTDIPDHSGETAVFLRNRNNRFILVHLHGAPGYEPSSIVREELQRYARLWNRLISAAGDVLSAAALFSMLGRLADDMHVGLAVIDDSLRFIFINNYLPEAISIDRLETSLSFEDFVDNLSLRNETGKTCLFADSPLADVFKSSHPIILNYQTRSPSKPVSIVASPVATDETILAVILFIPAASVPRDTNLSMNGAIRTLENLKQSISPVLRTVDGLLKQIAGSEVLESSETARIALSSVDGNIKLLTKIAEGLEGLTALGAIDNTYETFSTHDVISELIEATRKENADLSIDFEIDPELPQIHAPRDKIVRILRCLLENVFRYGTIQAHSTVMIVYDHRKGRHNFAISDSGPGIPESYAEKIFEPFFRMSHEAVEGSFGSGVGLTVARELARSMGGDIHLETSPQGGATFIFSLPVDVSGYANEEKV